MTAALCTGGSLVVPCGMTAAHGATPGQVCMFLAPHGVLGLGHVGWAYRDADQVHYTYGATSDIYGSWRMFGTQDEMRSEFRRKGDAGGYEKLRCILTAGMNPRAASDTADQLYSEPYDGIFINCLTVAIKIFKAYDSSGGLNRLPAGQATPPRYYFYDELDGFAPAGDI